MFATDFPTKIFSLKQNTCVCMSMIRTHSVLKRDDDLKCLCIKKRERERCRERWRKQCGKIFIGKLGKEYMGVHLKIFKILLWI